jgi:hypothetical protein
LDSIRPFYKPSRKIGSFSIHAFRVKLPSISAKPIVMKKERLFSDDFERAELGKDKD